ncbi:hypothetical protein ASG85_20565 [Paenibacillus sp. Soil724D2]|nr:hypothetical protein [Paenibacillus sp. Soil724D2]KRE50648.1 hypothetical protein ASG85_20565 [Paenibacillus sp. Soil724D2]
MTQQLNEPDARILNWLDSQGYKIIQTEDSKSKWVFGQNLLGEHLFINVITRQSEQPEINIIDNDEKLETIKNLKEKYNCEAYFAVLVPKNGQTNCYIFSLQELLEFPWNIGRERVKALSFNSKYENKINQYERSGNQIIQGVEDKELERSIANIEYIIGEPTKFYLLTVKKNDDQYEVRFMEDELLHEKRVVSNRLRGAKIEGITMLLNRYPSADLNHFMMVHYKADRNGGKPWVKDTNEEVKEIYQEIKKKIKAKLTSTHSLRGVPSMINLNEYQTIFNNDTTHERCKQVIDQIEAPLKPIVQQFMDSFNDPSLYLHTYGVTLTTTYHDALNPKYAEQRKESNIGRKYFIQIMKKIGDSEVNALTLEFNGMERQVLLSVETNFYPIWEAVRLNRINGIINELNPVVDVLVSSQSKESTIRELLKRQELEDFIKSCIKPRKRPWLYFAKRISLEGEWSVEKLLDELKDAWHYLEPIRNYLQEEKKVSVHAAHILTLVQVEDANQDMTLFHRSYQLQYGSVEQVKTGVCRQQFSLKDQEQLIVKGYVVYYQFQEKQSPHQVLAVKLDGHSHIYTNVRNLLGTGTKDWWIRKLFATQSLNNAEVLETGMSLLRQHGLEVKESEYLAGTYDNVSEAFTEAADVVKKRLITAALLFAHASEKLQLPTVDEMGPIIDEADEQGGDPEEEEYTASFQLTSILELIANSSFTFAKEIIRDLHLNLTALDDKHFVILSGISGTGKTQLARLYANAVYGMEYEADNPYMSVIPVRPDWTDSSSLFGYYSSFENRYVIPEFLRMVLKAHQEREKPHFVVFDEMNLARVEYYLSDYLSGVESRKEIPLHNRADLIDIPKTVTVPPNLYVIGTVNVDETTHSISDKVLDRAFVMTLSEVDFDTFWNRSAEDVRLKLQIEFDFLKQVHGILKPYYLHFGYRSMNEMLQKLSHNKDLEANIQMDETEALEKVIIEKVLPKVRGDDSISEMLTKLHQVFEAKFGLDSAALGIIERMEKEIARYGAAQFWR